MKKLIFHIGCPKAASSTLQLDYFPNLNNVNYLGIYPNNNIGTDLKGSDNINYYTRQPVKDFLSYLFSTESNISKFEIQKLSNSFFEILDNDKINILSTEKLMGVFYVPRDFKKKLKRAKKFFEINKIEVQFLVIIRNQIDLLRSQYTDLPFNPQYCEYKHDYVKFSHWLDLCSHHYEFSLFDMLDYSCIVKKLNYIFQNPKINILLFEELKDDNKIFQIKLFDLLKNNQTKLIEQTHRNSGASHGQNLSRIILTRLSKFIPVPLKKIIPKNKIEILFSKTLKIFFRKKFNFEFKENDVSTIKNKFASSNKSLQNLYNLPLKKYNYPL